MRRTLTRHSVAALALAFLSNPARAQLPAGSTTPATTEWFTGAAIAMTTSHSGEQFQGNPSALAPEIIGGTALEGLFAAGAFVTPHLGFAGEFNVPRSFRVLQTWGRNGTTWDHEHRDLSLTGLVLMRNGVGRVQLTGAVGAGNVWSRTKTVQRTRFGQSRTEPPSFINTYTRQITDLALVGGAELSVSVSTHLSLVPQFRLIFVPRDVIDISGQNLASLLYHMGVGMRVRFP